MEGSRVMDVDRTKWMVGYAEGFEWNSKSVVTPHDIIVPGSNQSIWNNVYLPLLLQRAIEGVNRDKESFNIQQTEAGIEVNDWGLFDGVTYFLFKDYDSEDQAKIEALKYIKEHTNEQESSISGFSILTYSGVRDIKKYEQEKNK